MSSSISRDTWDNHVVVIRDGSIDATWDGKVKNLIYDVGTMAWIAQTASSSGTPASVSVTNFPATQPVSGSVAVTNQLVTVAYDTVTVVQTSSTVETYQYRTGGASGTIVATVTVTYTDSTKDVLSSVVRT